RRSLRGGSRGPRRPALGAVGHHHGRARALVREPRRACPYVTTPLVRLRMPTSSVRDATRTNPMLATSLYPPAEHASTLRWHVAGLVGILLLAAFLDGFRLDQMGLGSRYYAAAVMSMLTSWHAFFFAALDPAGFLAVDKPPLGLWVEAASAELLGF